MNYDNLKLKNQLCFPLYACSREIIKMYKPHLDHIGLTYTQYIAMMVLWEDESCTVKELGQKLFLDSGTLTPLLKRLEQEGLITRERSSEDERSLIVTLTKKGTQLKDDAICIPTKMAEDMNLSSEEAHILYTLLYKLLDSNK
ncbi:MarR family transcriptional regulator [Anaerotignum sp.]|uniref:MarR family winged helix-turn-helix transcriptional regulator n=1 Tax=Anaerotignum sp. TaxID=2039241 RepID=UPI0033217F57